MMENRYALVGNDGVVDNVVEWDGQADWSPPQGQDAVPAPAAVSPGWRLDGGEWLPPQEED